MIKLPLESLTVVFFRVLSITLANGNGIPSAETFPFMVAWANKAVLLSIQKNKNRVRFFTTLI